MVVFPGEQEWNDARGWVVVEQNDFFPYSTPYSLYTCSSPPTPSPVPLYFVPSLYFLTRHSCLTKLVPHTRKQQQPLTNWIGVVSRVQIQQAAAATHPLDESQ